MSPNISPNVNSFMMTMLKNLDAFSCTFFSQNFFHIDDFVNKCYNDDKAPVSHQNRIFSDDILLNAYVMLVLSFHVFFSMTKDNMRDIQEKNKCSIPLYTCVYVC